MVLRGLAGTGCDGAWQNLDSQGLTCKILRNKELASEVGVPGLGVENRLGEAASIGQGCAFRNSRSRLDVTREGFLFVEGCGKNLWKEGY